MAHPHAHQAKTGQQRAKHRYADGGSVSPGYGSVAQQFKDSADVEKTGVNVDMRYGADQISNPDEKSSVFLARNRLNRDPTLRSS